METMIPGRIYATIGKTGAIKAIAEYDTHGMRVKQIDLIGKDHSIEGDRILPINIVVITMMKIVHHRRKKKNTL
ncbi:hypothetical protein [Dubosiella newyorkensis]|uniref:hypothetical protein n=1 Tax=Dubosiella newyorkensis TaxID=1862672 RepID=UPI00272AFD86|nr:hypothetical protein [Dubosiella newyorkensis]